MKNLILKRIELIFISLAITLLAGCANREDSSFIPPQDMIKVMWHYLTKGAFMDNPPLKTVTPEEQAKWNHFTDAEIAQADWGLAEQMRRSRYVTDRPVPLRLGTATFMVPSNYFGVQGGLQDEKYFREGLTREDGRSGPMYFYLWDFSGKTPRRDNPSTHSDEWVDYNFGYRSTQISPEQMIAKSPYLYDSDPNFKEFGLDAYLPRVVGYETMSIEERRHKFAVSWLGRSSHGGMVYIRCGDDEQTCLGHGTHLVGKYQYQFGIPRKYLSRWYEVETGVHTKIMSWKAM